MAQFIQGWGFTLVACGLITVVFGAALFHLYSELRWVRAVTDHLGWELVAEPGAKSTGLQIEAFRDEAHAVAVASDAQWAQKQVRTWQMRAWRLESALAFWIDLLRQLGLLGTVVGLGMSLTTGGGVSQLLGPLALAVWTTVCGLAYSIWLSAQYGMKLPAWVDACEKNIEAWDARRKQRAGAAA
jgi:hypothetical protein